MKENNFKKALNELLTFDTGADGGTAAESTQNVAASAETDSVPSFSSEAPSQESDSSASAPEPAPYSTPAQPLEPVFNTPKQESVLTDDVIIDGNFRSKSNLKIACQINGNVTCEGAVTLTGNVAGDVAAVTMKILAGGVTGNIQIIDDLTVEKGSYVKGDVTSSRLIFNGDAEGNMMVKDTVELREAATVVGNVSCRSISMYNGARLRGMMDVGDDDE